MKRVLIIRMSSLGDVILASSALTALRSRGVRVDWLVHEDYAEVLRGHPDIDTLLTYNRDPKLSSWMRFCRTLVREGAYDHVFDLHGNIRSTLLRALFALNGIPTTGVSKSRWSTWGRYVFKSMFPKRWLPPARTAAFARAVGGSGSEKPDLRHLALKHQGLSAEMASGAKYFCVMPSSRWSGKEWPAAKYLDVLRQLRGQVDLIPVVMGRSSDPNSVALVSKLEEAKLPFIAGVGRWSLGEVAAVLFGAQFYFGADTGLAHLAEAMGRPSLMLFVPGVPDLGFGPWNPQSKAISPSIWCRPCGKDGRYCHRIFKRHECMNKLSAASVVERVLQSQAGKV